jgi:Transposase DDE domain
MSQRQVLSQWTHTVARHVPVLRQSQVKVVAAFSLGVALARRCTLSVVAEALPGLGKPDTVERRLQRFMSNPRVAWQPAAEALALWVLGGLQPGGVVVLLVDETSLDDKLKVMVISLAYRGRAIPLGWWCYRPTAYPMGQVALITTLLQRLAPALPARGRILVQADRGIGTSPELLRAIQQRGWYYLVRVQSQVRLRLDDGRTVPFAHLVPRPHTRWAGWVYAFKKAGWCRCWAVGQWRAPHQEAWLLLTNWPGAHGNWYGLRMWEELAFRDLKSLGWQWQRSRVWDPEHANRLWLVLALAYAWALSLGTQVIRTATLRRELTRGKDWRHSVFHLGLRLLTRWITLERRLFYELLFIPHLPTLPKSVVH